MRHALLLSLVLLVAAAAAAQAQVVNDPYSDPLSRGAGTGWPPFFKPLKISPRDQLYYAMGWCRTMHYQYKPEDLVVVDKLPEGEFKGRVDQLSEQALVIDVASPATKKVLVLTYPAATQAVVVGKATRAALKSGMYLRFTGVVDSRGRLADPVDRVEIVGADEARRVSAIEANRLAPVVGRIGQMHGDQITLTVAEGRIRSISFNLASHAAIELFTSDLAFAESGDPVEVKGRVYHPDETPDETALYATKLHIERRELLTAPPTPRRKLTPASR